MSTIVANDVDGDAKRAKRGVLLVGHGTRDPRGQREFLDLAKSVSDSAAGWVIEPGFLELASPTITDAWQRLSQRAATEVFAVPLVLFAAGHAKEDIPDALMDAAGQPVPLAEHLGLHPRLLELSRQRARQALPAESSPERTILLIVGRGSSDSDAIAEMQRFCRNVAQPDCFSQTKLAFVAKAKPTLAEAIQEIGHQPAERIIVQPHLLFSGRVCDAVFEAVESAGRRFPQQQWIAAKPLGPSPLVADAVQDRFTQLIDRLQLGS